MKTTLIPVLCLALAGCDVLGVGTDCTREALPALTVRLVDATTGDTPAADTGLARAVDGAFVDSAALTRLMLEDDIGVGLAYERPGRYTVEVTVPGYDRWTLENVRVGRTDDRCHVETRAIVAELVAAAPDEAAAADMRRTGSE